MLQFKLRSLQST